MKYLTLDGRVDFNINEKGERTGAGAVFPQKRRASNGSPKIQETAAKENRRDGSLFESE